MTKSNILKVVDEKLEQKTSKDKSVIDKAVQNKLSQKD